MFTLQLYNCAKTIIEASLSEPYIDCDNSLCRREYLYVSICMYVACL